MSKRDVLEHRRLKKEKERKKVQLGLEKHLPVILQSFAFLIPDVERRVEVCRNSKSASEMLRFIARDVERLGFEEVPKTQGEFFGFLMDLAHRNLKKEVYEATQLGTPSEVLRWFADWLQVEMGGSVFVE